MKTLTIINLVFLFFATVVSLIGGIVFLSEMDLLPAFECFVLTALWGWILRSDSKDALNEMDEGSEK